MTTSDWESVRTIYAEGIATGNATFETDVPPWKKWDVGHLPFARLIATDGEVIAGWAALSAVSRREVYRGVAEVSIYLGTSFRGRRVGRELMAALIAASEENGIWTLQAGIFPENTPSIALHLGHGFREVGRRSRIGRMNGVWRDTVLLERRSEVVGRD